MDQGTNIKRAVNPRQNANIVSIITFFFTYDFLKKGFKRDLQEPDIYEILKDYRAKQLGDRLEVIWNREKLKPRPSIVRVLFLCFGRTYLMYGLMQLFMKTILLNISPMCMGKLVSYFTPGQTALSKADACKYAILTIGINTIYFVYSHTYFLLIAQLGLKMRASFSTLLYRKALRLTPKALSRVTTGKIITLITKDVISFDLASHFANDLWIGLIQTIVISVIIFMQIGLAGVIGLAVFLLSIPMHLYTGQWIGRFKIKSAGRTDERLRATQEVLTSMKIIKMFTWENFFCKNVSECRKAEIRMLRRIYCLKAFSLALGMLSSKISFYVCVMMYLYFGNTITAEKAFVVLGCYHILRSTLTIYIPLGVAYLAEFRSAVQRVTEVLLTEEIPENVSKLKEIVVKYPKINLNKVTVTDQEQVILHGLTFEIVPGLTTVAGYVGSGKSALLRLFLKDLTAKEGTIDINGTISYASQEPWLFPGTIKQNILFGQPYNPERYKKVLQVCCLNKDLQLLPFKDSTITGDKGLNLSRGQQARINLARAVYKDCEIYLLDDVFSALDAGVSKEVFRECIQSFLEHKIVVLVTHHMQHLKQSDKVVVMNLGTVASIGRYEELEEQGVSFNIFDVEKEKKELDGDDENEEFEESEEAQLLKPKASVFSEQKKDGNVNVDMYRKYFSFGGGPFVFAMIFIVFTFAQGTMSYSDILVSKWVDIEQKITTYKINQTNPEDYKQVTEKRSFTLTLYNIMIITTTILTLGRAFAYFLFSSRASMRLHKNIFTSILNAPMSFFDTHLIGNILNRFSRDMATIDDHIPYLIFDICRIALILSGIIYVISSINLIFLIPSAVLGTTLFVVRRLYLPASRSLMRLEGATRSPVIGHLAASLEGISTVRACNAEKILTDEFDGHLDLFNSACYMYMTGSRAFGFLMDVLAVTYTGTLTTIFLTIDTGALAGKVGLALSQAFSLTGMLQWGVRQWAELENQMTAVERVFEYSQTKPEDKRGINPKNWPLAGRIEYKNVYLTYQGSKTPIFNNLNFTVEPKEKIGIVGRTGAGKSSIISTLFKLYEVEGSITIDGVDIKTIAADVLRSKISIIPQSPVLFTGTVRDNLDPYNELSDIDLWKALEEVRLKETVPTLNEKIIEGGCNFSAGQRQLICLARAILKKNKILVLDEATASVDPQTDVFIQKTIQRIFVDCTVLTIAHRLDTVLHSDKVMVIHEGSLLEYDAPDVLLKNKESAFYKMVKQAGLLKE